MQIDYTELIDAALEQVSSDGICRMTADCRPELGGCSRCSRAVMRGVDIARVDVYREQNLVSFTMDQGCVKQTPCRVYIRNVDIAIHK